MSKGRLEALCFVAESGSTLPGMGQQLPSTATLVRETGETDSVDPSLGPLGRPATLVTASRARRGTVEAAGKQAGEQTCRSAVTQKPAGNLDAQDCGANGRVGCRPQETELHGQSHRGQTLRVLCSGRHHPKRTSAFE